MKRLGITRVTNTTMLDCIGIPVYTSIRPDAALGTLCVNAGKGSTSEEAQVGAAMEAIEFAMAEHRHSKLPIVAATVRDVLECRSRPASILDLCPKLGAVIPLDSPINCVEMKDIVSGESLLIPAELVFLPTPKEIAPVRYFISNSTGLSSGNTVLEASVHGLSELIERDISSFYNLQDRSVLVDPNSFPAQAAKLVELLSSAGIELFVRYQENPFNIAWFSATIFDAEHPSPFYVNAGYGCHPDRSIALIRAITEAVQSRMSFVHGGRDDLDDIYKKFNEREPAYSTEYVDRLRKFVSIETNSIAVGDIPDHSKTVKDIASAFDCLAELLEGEGIKRILRVCYTDTDDALQVVRMIAPGLENFSETSQRMGPRLRDFVKGMK